MTVLARLTALALVFAIGLGASPREALAAPARERRPGDAMVATGVGVLCLGIAAYGLLAAGLGVGSRAEQDLAALQEDADRSRRRAVMDRGVIGNRLAIAGAVIAVVATGVGIPLVVIGRRRHEAAVALNPTGVTVEVRF